MQRDRTRNHHQSEKHPKKKPFADDCNGLNQKRNYPEQEPFASHRDGFN